MSDIRDKKKKKRVINISERQLTEIEKDLFSKDFNFSIKSKKRPNENTHATFKKAVKDLEINKAFEKENIMINYSIYTKHLRLFLRCHYNKNLPKVPYLGEE